MNGERQVEYLSERLRTLGFPAHLERELRLHCCLEQPVFVLSCLEERDGDQLTARVFMQRGEDTGWYSCRYYDAVLRKRIEVPAVIIGEVDTQELDAMMARVDWKRLFCSGISEATAPAEEEDTRELVETVALRLHSLQATGEGQKAADLLTARHWQDTPLEPYCRGLPAIKSAHQLLQRFYLFEGEPLITLDDAYRFLQYRWQERKMQNRKEKQDPEHPEVGKDKATGKKQADRERRRKG